MSDAEWTTSRLRVEYDSSYLRTAFGVLKVAQLVLNIVSVVCGSVAISLYWNGLPWFYTCISGLSQMGIAFFFLINLFPIKRCRNLRSDPDARQTPPEAVTQDQLLWKACELIYYFTMIPLWTIVSILVASQGSKVIYAIAAFFGFTMCLLTIIDGYLLAHSLVALTKSKNARDGALASETISC